MSSSDRSPRRPPSFTKKTLFALVTTLAFFVLSELCLGLLGVQPVTQVGDPFVGFSGHLPLFTESQRPVSNAASMTQDSPPVDFVKAIQMRTAPAKMVWFNDQSFSKEKATGTRRIFCLGGSTTYGRPFSDSTSFCGWLRRFLPLVDPDHRWEVINAGGISYASYRVTRVMEELVDYQPDLFVVLSAHNEFLERRTYASMFERDSLAVELDVMLQKTRLWSLFSRAVGRSSGPRFASDAKLAAEVDEILNHTPGPVDYHRDQAWTEAVNQHYKYNLSSMVDIAREAGAEIVFLTAASNLRDCSPFKSEHSVALSDDQDHEFSEVMGLIETELAEQRFDQAVVLAESLVALDPRYAQAQYLYGKALFGMGRWKQSEEAFLQAIDEDVCPLRATRPIRNTLQNVAKDKKVMILDVVDELRQHSEEQSGHACFGSELFLDHVHPTIDVHRRIALWLLDVLRASGWLKGRAISADEIQTVESNVNEEIDPEVQGVAFRNLAKVLHWSGKYAEAVPRARDAIRLLPDELESRFILADCLYQTGRIDQALEMYRELFETGDFARANLPYGMLLSEHGDLIEAKYYLMRALLSERERDRIRAHYDLGLVHLQLGEYEFALESLRESLRYFPDDAATLVLIAEAKLGQGDWISAVEDLRRVTEIEPENFYAHDRLGEVLLEKGRLEEAEKHIDAALSLEPSQNNAKRKQEVIQQRLQKSTP